MLTATLWIRTHKGTIVNIESMIKFKYDAKVGFIIIQGENFPSSTFVERERQRPDNHFIPGAVNFESLVCLNKDKMTKFTIRMHG